MSRRRLGCVDFTVAFGALLVMLYVARGDGEEINATRACQLTGLGFATMSRLLKRMAAEGLFTRRASARRGSPIFIELSDDAASRMDRLLAELG